VKITHADDTTIEFFLDEEDFVLFRCGYLGRIVYTREPYKWLAELNIDSYETRLLERKIDEAYGGPVAYVVELCDGTRMVLNPKNMLSPTYPFILWKGDPLEARAALKDMEVPSEEA
jgi:hypothetical protein